jgi:site-specific recombinase XerD
MTTAITRQDDMVKIVELVTDSLASQKSRTMYQAALLDFLTWYENEGRPGLTKATVQRWKTCLQAKGLSSSTINQRLSAVRKLASEAADNGLIDPVVATGITKVKGVRSAGVRSGNWLDWRQAMALLHAPDTTTLKGLRDQAILAVMLGAGLRRSEVAGLTFDHVQLRDGRFVIVDLRGKGNRTRTVPIPSWTKQAIDAWAAAAELHEGRIFRRVNKGNRLAGDGLTDQAVQDVVKYYADHCQVDLAAHDLRRSFAKLALKGGAAIQQIQLSLGHASIMTTERYLGVIQDLTDAPCDHLGLRLSAD